MTEPVVRIPTKNDDRARTSSRRYVYLIPSEFKLTTRMWCVSSPSTININLRKGVNVNQEYKQNSWSHNVETRRYMTRVKWPRVCQVSQSEWLTKRLLLLPRFSLPQNSLRSKCVSRHNFCVSFTVGWSPQSVQRLSQTHLASGCMSDRKRI